MSEIESTVQDLLSTMLGKSPSEFKREAVLRDDFDVDSAEMVELICALEKKFHRTFPQGVERQVQSVGDLYDLVTLEQAPTLGGE